AGKEEKPKPQETQSIRADVEKLEGPKVLGKIQLDEKPRSSNKKKIPVASSSSNVETERQKKKRRNRICGHEQENATTGGTGGGHKGGGHQRGGHQGGRQYGGGQRTHQKH